MDDLSREARLIEEVVRRVLTRYQEHLHTEDYHRRSLQVAMDDLPSLVIGALAAVREGTDTATPSPYDLSAFARSSRSRR
jgi:hypothetical protein